MTQRPRGVNQGRVVPSAWERGNHQAKLRNPSEGLKKRKDMRGDAAEIWALREKEHIPDALS
jgi:hypothetical protein